MINIQPKSATTTNTIKKYSISRFNNLGKIEQFIIALIFTIGITTTLIAIYVKPSTQTHTIPNIFADSSGKAITSAAALVVNQSIGTCNYQIDGMIFPRPISLIPDSSEMCYQNIAKILTGKHKNHFTLIHIPTNRFGLSHNNFSENPTTKPPIAPNQNQPKIKVGDKIRLTLTTTAGKDRFHFYDFVRGKSITFWFLLTVLLVGFIIGWKGIRALIGLLFAFIFMIYYTLPAITNGGNPVALTIISTIIILYPVLYFTHGISFKTSAALLGTSTAILTVGLVSWLITKTLRITGLAQEENIILREYQVGVNLSGILLAGFIIGSLGVLNDITVSQASNTYELTKANKKLTMRNLFFSSFRIGKDHIASSIYTLIFAYVGAALPYLLLFSTSKRSYLDIITSEIGATEFARSIVGILAILLAMPFTSFIAALLAKNTIKQMVE